MWGGGAEGGQKPSAGEHAVAGGKFSAGGGLAGRAGNLCGGGKIHGRAGGVADAGAKWLCGGGVAGISISSTDEARAMARRTLGAYCKTLADCAGRARSVWHIAGADVSSGAGAVALAGRW